ncbi:MAG: DNA repair protein RecO [Clostridiales bacterium]|nr:DNA repair protein RecO [Clostridiales bacterium]
MNTISCKGIILSSKDFKEKDKLVNVLTSDLGLIRVCVKGSAKQGSRNAAFTVPYMLCEFTLTVSHGFYYLKEASIIENNSNIILHLTSLVTAAHIAECLIDLSYDTPDAVHRYYELAVYAYYALAKAPEDYLLIYSAFNWRLLTYAGNCIVYDDNDIDHNAVYKVSLEDGTLVKTDASAYDPDVLSGVEVSALNHFATCKINNLFTGNASQRVLSDLKTFTTAYMSYQFDREYTALDVLDQGIIPSSAPGTA